MANTGKRRTSKPVAVAGDAVAVPFLGAPATFPADVPVEAAEAFAKAMPTSLIPPAAVPADLQVKDTDMATTIDNAATAADTAAEKGKAFLGDMNARAKGAMEKGARMVEDANAFGKGNVEAMVESSKIAIRGFETLGQDAAAFAKKQFEEATEAMRALAATKSPTEFMKLQGDYLRSSFDAMVAEGSRSTEKMLKLAGEIAQPIQNRVALAAEKVKAAA